MLKKVLPFSVTSFSFRNSYLFILHLILFIFPTYSQTPTEQAEYKIKIDRLIENTLPILFKNEDLNAIIANNDQIMALAEKLESNDKYHYLAFAYNLKGYIFKRMREPKKAEASFYESIGYAQLSGSTILEAKAYNNLAILLVNEYEDFDLATDYYKKAFNVVGKEDPVFKNMLSINIAWGYIKKREYDTAKRYLDQARDYTEELDDVRQKTYLYHLYGNYYAAQNELIKAQENYSLSLALGKSKNIELVPEIYYDYAENQHQLKKYDTAFLYMKKHIKLKDEQYGNTQRAQNEIANARFEVARFRREKQVAEQKMNNSRTFSIITIVSMIVLAIFFSILWILNKDKRNLAKKLAIQNQELQVANEKYLTASKQKSQFINTLSHELRTPLYGVVGITSLLLEDKKLNEQQSEYLNSLKFSGDYLLNLINDILLMSKIEVNKIEPILENFNLKELVTNIANSFRHHSDESENIIFVEIEKSIPDLIYGDRLRLSQILINLIGNATKFTKNGTIWLRLIKQSSTPAKIKVRFEVEDNGLGIPKDKQEEIFENFSQLDTKENAFKGTGLGLPIIKKLVEFYGGKINLKSTIGKGSLFWFELDFDLLQEKELSGLEKSNIPKTIFNKKVLIVEDNKINQLVTRKTLENSNFICEIADNGKIAVAMALRNNYDIILMDLNMPIMNGIEATKKIREFNSNIPIILLTASEMKKGDELIKDVGITDVLVKPYDTQHFFNVIIESVTA